MDVVDGYSPTLPHLKGLQNGDTATSAIKQVIFISMILNLHMQNIGYILITVQMESETLIINLYESHFLIGYVRPGCFRTFWCYSNIFGQC